MAKHKTRRSRRNDRHHFEGQTVDDLKRSLTLDSLTMENCFYGLFGELFEDVRPGRRPGEPEDIRVTQAGPGVRNQPNSDRGEE